MKRSNEAIAKGQDSFVAWLQICVDIRRGHELKAEEARHTGRKRRVMLVTTHFISSASIADNDDDNEQHVFISTTSSADNDDDNDHQHVFITAKFKANKLVLNGTTTKMSVLDENL